MEAPAAEAAQSHEQPEAAESPGRPQEPGAFGQRGDRGDRNRGGDGRVAGVELVVVDVERIVERRLPVRFVREPGSFGAVLGDVAVEPGETVELGATGFTVMAAPGHTLGHIVYYDAAGGHLFTGDALFSLGVGRMFEGTPGPMWQGLAALRDLPDETLVYCGHEYTVANAKFALSVDPGNSALKIRAAEAERARAEGRFTIPVSLGLEKRTNPFLRVDTTPIARAMNLVPADPIGVFAALRKAKDDF